MSQDLHGTAALVTAGGTGIGLGIAKRLAEDGCRVTICARREEVLAAAVPAGGVDGIVLQQPDHVRDLPRAAPAGQLAQPADGTCGDVPVVASVAGLARPRPLSMSAGRAGRCGCG